jgi:hypothetical protein
VLRNQGVGAPASAVIIYRCSDYTLIVILIILIVILIILIVILIILIVILIILIVILIILIVILIVVAVSHGLGTCAVLSPIGLALGIQASLLFHDECIRGSHTT